MNTTISRNQCGTSRNINGQSDTRLLPVSLEQYAAQSGDKVAAGMTWRFPTEREAKRRALLDAVERAGVSLCGG